MKQVIALLGSSRKQHTYRLLCQIQTILKSNNINMEIIPLYEYTIKECVGCEKCIYSNSCFLSDQSDELMEKLVCSDGIILSSPVYLQQISGKLKTFIDHTCRWYHRPELYGKPILSVATTKGSGLQYTLNYLTKVAIQWGAIPSGQIGRNFRTIDNPIKEQELDDFILYLHNPYAYKPSLKVLINYEIQKIVMTNLLAVDITYWQKKGWVDYPYYYDCNIATYKQWIAQTFSKRILSGITKKGQN